MKYDFSKCNNLQFKAKGDEGELMTGYLKVAKEGEECVVYVFTDWEENESLDSSLQIVTRNYERCEIIEDFSKWAEKHDLEITPRDPETYKDWKADAVTKYNKLILTDYEKELIHAQELEEKKKKCSFKEGDKVLVRDSDTSWKFDIFQNYEENACYSYECLSSEYEQCIPLNEHTWKLLGTTDEYKETNNNESH